MRNGVEMKFKKILNKIGSLLFYALLAMEIVLMIFFMVKRLTGQRPTMFGYQMFQVITSSMEPDLQAGDIIISKVYQGEELQIGDIITYIGREGDAYGKLITHKVTWVNGDEIITQGSANASTDPVIAKSDVIGVMIYKTVVFQKLYTVIGSATGCIFLLVLPLFILLIMECKDIIKQIRHKRKRKR